MLQIRKSNDRGYADHGWLKSHHTFSFADYRDPDHMGFRSLRVINEDDIAGGMGFGAHPHRDMEIITYVVSGELEHQDSMGTRAVIRPGEVQRMSAASGVVHSEYNPQKNQPVHLLQIWILPNQVGGKPGYGQKSFANELEQKKLVLAVSADGREGSIDIKQDADLYLSRLKPGDEVGFKVRPGRAAWIQLVKGQLLVNDRKITAGDGLAVSEGIRSTEAVELQIRALEPSEFILFDLV